MLVKEPMKSFLHTVDTQKSFEAAVEAVETKVAEKNFRVVNTYDVAATLTEQGFPRSPLKIIEVCNARLASEALEKDINVALMLPCPIAVYTEGRENFYQHDAALSPGRALSCFGFGTNRRRGRESRPADCR